MYNQSPTISSRDFVTRLLIEACKQSYDYATSDSEARLNSATRSRHHLLVNFANKTATTAADVIDFYSRRYYGTPAVVTYTHDMAIADGKAAGLTYTEARRIVLSAVNAGITGDALRQYVAQGIAQRKTELAARQTRQAATLARISA
jgi:hypothetical protein